MWAIRKLHRFGISEEQPQILRLRLPHELRSRGPKRAPLRMTRAGVGSCFPRSQKRDLGHPDGEMWIFHPRSPKARDRGHPHCGLEKITGTGATRRTRVHVKLLLDQE